MVAAPVTDVAACMRHSVTEYRLGTVLHLVVATPPLPETAGAEFLQILVAEKQVYTEK